MNRAKSKIIEFMRLKNELLEIMGIKGYFTKWDENDLMKMDDNFASYTWGALDRFPFCPFCEINRDGTKLACDGCTYGKRHGECDVRPGNTFEKIVDKFSDKFDVYWGNNDWLDFCEYVYEEIEEAF